MADTIREQKCFFVNDKKMVFLHVYCISPESSLSPFKDMNVTITFDEVVDNNTVSYIAASPPDYRSSFTGSGMPWTNWKQAFDNTPNKGTIDVGGASGTIQIVYPNSFYSGLGTVIIGPTLYLNYTSGGEERRKAIRLSDGVPYRLLSYPMKFTKPRKNVMFYDGTWDLPVRTQEQILRSARYPETNQMSQNFWGFKPPV